MLLQGQLDYLKMLPARGPDVNKRLITYHSDRASTEAQEQRIDRLFLLHSESSHWQGCNACGKTSSWPCQFQIEFGDSLDFGISEVDQVVDCLEQYQTKECEGNWIFAVGILVLLILPYSLYIIFYHFLIFN